MAQFELGDHVVYVGGPDTSGDVWTARRDEEHLCIVLQVWVDGVRVWDTVENDWWSSSPDRFTLASAVAQ